MTTQAEIKTWRFTISRNYPPGTLGHTDTSARQGYYEVGRNVLEAKAKLYQRLRNEHAIPADYRMIDLHADPN